MSHPLESSWLSWLLWMPPTIIMQQGGIHTNRGQRAMPLLSISDELCRRAQKAAETQGKTLEQFVGEVLSNAVGELLETNQRNEIPVVRVPPGSPPINLTAVRRILEEDGF